MKDSKDRKIINIIVISLAAVLLTVYAWSLIVLHFNQTMYSQTGMFESDLYAHIEMALDGWGYSILAVIFRLLALIPNETIFHMGIAVFLGACEIATLAITFIWSKKLELKNWEAVILTGLSSFVMPAFIRAIQPYRYIGYQSPSIWHNSTYIVMKLLALMCIILYIQISRKYKEEMKASDIIVFAVLLALTTAVKTNFVIAFAPVALLFLIIDKIMGVPFKRLLLAAMTIVPTFGVMLFQRLVLFGEETGNGIVIDPLYSVYLRAERPYFTMILSAAFPVFVFLINIIPVLKDTIEDFKYKKSLKHREFLFGWTMWFAGFVELLLLRETGNRELDDNFAWGYDFCLFIIFIISILYFIRNIREKERILNSKLIKWIYIVLGTVMLGYHTFCGLYFYIGLTKGMTFFMQ